ncbi:MAG: RNA polymerase sigma-70 factor [bacterium]|nr:RNA polymerase sigma-70 factor [bacterium]
MTEKKSDLYYFELLSKGDQSAFRHIFNTYYKDLVVFTKQYVKDMQIAENIVQDVFMKIWSNREKIRILSNVRSYLFTAARNTALNHLRKASYEVAIDDEAYIRTDNKTPYEEIYGKETYNQIIKSIENLPEKCRMTYSMFIFNGMSYAEIAEIMDVSINTVKTHMFRAVKMLRESLSTIILSVLFLIR